MPRVKGEVMLKDPAFPIASGRWIIYRKKKLIIVSPD